MCRAHVKGYLYFMSKFFEVDRVGELLPVVVAESDYAKYTSEEQTRHVYSALQFSEFMSRSINSQNLEAKNGGAIHAFPRT